MNTETILCAFAPGNDIGNSLNERRLHTDK